MTDANGAVVPDVTVILTSKETARKHETKTSDDGFYRISGLPPGAYTLSAEKLGFARTSQETLTVKAEETQGFDVALNLQGVAATGCGAMTLSAGTMHYLRG